jgi:dipeptidyl aminopeptidase/acylaminoacyl peptidase
MPSLSRAALASAAALLSAAAAPRPVHEFLEIALSPDAKYVASVEGDTTPSGEVDVRALVIRATADGAATTVLLPCGAVSQCTPSSLVWGPDKQLAFILRTPGSHAHTIYTVGAAGGSPRALASINGTMVGLRYGPGGRLAVLATTGTEKEVGAVEAGAPIAGVLGADALEQRIAIVQPNGTLAWASPPDLFVYEYDWRPDGAGFVGTAAPGNGDNNWWIAKLYAFDASASSARVLYTQATPRQQIASPRVSPDGHTVSFIGGLMSDFGSTGGDAFLLALDKPNAKAVNITPNSTATVTALAWSCDGQTLLASKLVADERSFTTLRPNPAAPETVLATSQEVHSGTDDPASIACATDGAAIVHQTFTRPPEIEVGKIGAWHDLTHANTGLTAPAIVTSVAWRLNGYSEQGWLLLPVDTANDTKRPMIVSVHGGPAAASQPYFAGAGMRARLLTAGYAIFMPNPRGSFGQGEAFTAANVRDLGHGDLRDILAGITEVEKTAPIDDKRLGITGWSYGGFITMWTVTQTNRFRAAVAGAGVSNWQSYYGENGIDRWMIPYFGASVYDDPDIYARSSPIAYIKHVRTPTLSVVGERDIECPAPQTEEFWHALNALGITTEAVIYPGEGHHMRDPKNIEDFETRLVAWFDKYLK